MDKLEYYKKRFYAYYNYVLETQSESVRQTMDESRKMVDDAFEAKNEKLLRALDRELTVEINEYPPEYRQAINKRIEAEAGINAEEVEKKRLKKLQTIIKRGKIKNRDEYELVHSRIDELIHHTPKDDPARKDLFQLERLLGEFYTPN